MRKTASPPKKGALAQQQQNVIQNAYGGAGSSQQTSSSTSQQPQQQTSGQGQQTQQSNGPVAAQASQMLVKRQLTFTQDQLMELQRAGRFGKQPVPQEYAVIPPQSAEFRGRKTLVLDLDETLIHSKFSEAHLRACRTRGRCDFQMRIVVENRPIQVFVLIRPGVLFFLQKLASIYEIVLYTASMSIYANPLVDTLDQDQLIPMRLYREHCFSFQGSYIKDLSLLGRDMKDVLIVDNSPNAYYFHNENAVPILSWYDDPDDRCLFEMIPLLEALSQVHDVRQVIPKFVRKDINLVDFPKAAWVLNDAYRQMHTAAIGTQNGDHISISGAEGDPKQNSKKVLSPTKTNSSTTAQNAAQTPTKKQSNGTTAQGATGSGNPKLEDAYERKPSPINLKPLSPRTIKINKKEDTAPPSGAQEGPSANDVKITTRKERTFSPRQLKISSKQTAQQQSNETDQTKQDENKPKVSKKRSDTNPKDASATVAQQSNQAETDAANRREGRGKSQNNANGRAAQFSPTKGQEDDQAIDQVQRRSRRKVSHQMKQNESSDLDAGASGALKSQEANRSNQRGATQDALDNGLAAEATANNQLYQKVSQRKQIVQRNVAGQPIQNQIGVGTARRRPSANNSSGGTASDANDNSKLSSQQNVGTSGGNQAKNASFSTGRVGNVQLEISTNKAELAAGGPLVDLPPHLQKIMQARSTTNKTSSMARQAIVIPQGNIITPVNGKVGNSHRIGTSNGIGQNKQGDGSNQGSGLNATFQNIPKSNNLFQTSPTEREPDHKSQAENLSQKRLPIGSKNGGANGQAENLNRSFSNQAGVTNGSLSTNVVASSNGASTGGNGHQSSTTWASRQQVAQNTTAQHSSRLNGRRKLSRNDQAASTGNNNTPGTGQQISVQGNLSIRRGITRYQQATSHQRGGHEQPHNVNGIMSSRNESQHQSHQAGNVKLIGKNSLHMKRRSEYPNDASSNQWHLPDPSNGASGIITSESQKNTAPGFNFQKHNQATPAAWGPNGTQASSGQVVNHSQSTGGVSQTSHNQKRVINQSVGQLNNVKHINSAQLANVPATTGHKKVQSLLSNIQQNGGAGRNIHIMQPGVTNTQPTSSPHLNTSGLGSQSSSTRHRKPPMLVRTTNHPQRMNVSQVPGSQPNSTQNRNRNRDQWINFANIMHQNVPTGDQTAQQSQLTPMGGIGGHKLSSDFIVKNGSSQAAASAAQASSGVSSPANASKQNFLGLMQTQPVNTGISKAKFKNSKPLTNARGKSVPQERPSNSQGQANQHNNNHANSLNGAGTDGNHVNGAVGNGHSSATKSSTGIRISSQRQQFISSSNKTIKTLKQFNQSGGRQQPHTAEHQQK